MDIFGFKAILITLLVFVSLERLLPLHPHQKLFRRGWANDLIFLILNGMLVRIALLTFLALVIVAASRIMPKDFQTSISELPYWVQIPMAIVLSDFGVYGMHRLFHAVPWLWKFHAIHHSSEELDWLAAVRVHPVDQVLTRGAALLPIVTLGFSEWTIFIYGFLSQWQSFLIHANVRIEFGPLRFLLASPEFHHWHHSDDREARDKNFAAQLSLLDALFGSLHLPRGKAPTTYGLGRPMPQRYVPQLLYPFMGDRAFHLFSRDRSERDDPGPGLHAGMETPREG
jgi:sterol desaturase/sphingolipid hydroxylase (fatty acid hydroxylase superfamily)